VSFVPAVAGWVGRAELAQVVSALTAAGSGAVALTTGLVGAGGFGKTTLAAKACQDRRVRRRFRGGIVWLTVGRDTDGPGLAARIREVIAASGGDSGVPFTSPEQAGRALGGALSGRGRTLLVADDVWTAAQLEPFAAAGQPWRLLVTTRRPAVLDAVAARQIKVDAMPKPVARLLLARDLPVMDAERERELLELTGRWPLLLNLVNHRLAGEVRRGAGVDAAAVGAAGRLREAGPAVFDIGIRGSGRLRWPLRSGTAWRRWIWGIGTGSSSWGFSLRTPRSRWPRWSCCGGAPAGWARRSRRRCVSGWMGCRWWRWPGPGRRGCWSSTM
jgi:hypothetical protein